MICYFSSAEKMDEIVQENDEIKEKIDDINQMLDDPDVFLSTCSHVGGCKRS